VTTKDEVPALFSVGHEGRSQDELVAQVREHRVTVLLDVRLNAISRKPGFSKTRLAQSLSEARIAYRHARALGNPADNREPFRSGDREEGLRVYRDLLLSDGARAELQNLAELLTTERVAVLCFERDEHRCHRQAVVAAVSDRVPVVRLN